MVLILVFQLVWQLFWQVKIKAFKGLSIYDWWFANILFKFIPGMDLLNGWHQPTHKNDKC